MSDKEKEIEEMLLAGVEGAAQMIVMYVMADPDLRAEYEKVSAFITYHSPPPNESSSSKIDIAREQMLKWLFDGGVEIAIRKKQINQMSPDIAS